MPIPPEIDALFADEGEMGQSVRRYCCGTIAHRLLKLGWEDSINSLGPRMLILLSMYLPVHARGPIISEAWRRALLVQDDPPLRLLEKAFGLERVA